MTARTPTRWIFGAATALLTLLLTGCALAPGMRFETAPQKFAVYGQPGVQTTDPAQTGRSEDAPAANLLPINAELIARQQAEADQAFQGLQSLMTPPRPYTIGAGDILNIIVWDHPELVLPIMNPSTVTADVGSVPAGYTVSAEGSIQFAYVGHLKVAGLTEGQARDVLTRSLAKYINDPQITLRVQAYRSQKVYVDGEVRVPGQIIVNDIPLTLAEALARSGGVTPNGDTSQIQILRNGNRYSASLPDMIARGIHPARILLQDGDLIRITPREETKVSVMGEVNRPSIMPMRNGRLSLNEALAEAGGVNSNTADARQIYVIRNAGPSQPAQVFHLNARSPVMLAMAENFSLRPKDVVYVDPAPLALWNRVVSLLLPTSGLTKTTVDTANSTK